jgi:ABC-2 type transport system ATP-binding protein
MLQFNSVKKYYGHFLALSIPELSIPDGIYWLKGENGSGKTSFLKMIGGSHPFQGAIRLDRYDLKKNRVAFLQQVNYAEAEPLYPSFLTAEELVKLYCTIRKTDIAKAKLLLTDLHIIHAYRHPVGSYSSGMLKKLSLALAFIGNPKWILLDEPLITVDTEAVSTICNLIGKTHRDDQTSFIISSHQSFQTHQFVINQSLLAARQTITMQYDA